MLTSRTDLAAFWVGVSSMISAVITLKHLLGEDDYIAFMNRVSDKRMPSETDAMIDAFLDSAIELGIISKEDPQHGDRPGSAADT